MQTVATPLPSFVQIEPVGQCNLRCQMCPIQFRTDGPPYGPPAFMPFETFTRLVDQIPSMTELQLQGLGEPMMHPRFFDMVAYAASRGIEVSTNSNLTLLTPARAERLVQSGLHKLHVSIDGATPEIYERIRVRSNWRRVVGNLEGLVEAKRRLGSDLPRLRIVVVVMRQNLHELADLVRLAARVGVDAVFVQHLCHDFGEETLPTHYRPMHEFVAEQTLLGEDSARVEAAYGAARAAAAELGVALRLPRTTPRPAPPGTRGPAR
jgi:MoaA/NifB/PqqE/SkfB family radical SAM enzyme